MEALLYIGALYRERELNGTPLSYPILKSAASHPGLDNSHSDAPSLSSTLAHAYIRDPKLLVAHIVSSDAWFNGTYFILALKTVLEK